MMKEFKMVLLMNYPKYLTNNNDATQYWGPQWSPNGKWIAFVSYLDGDAEIFVMSGDGGSQTRLTNNNFADTSPTW